MLHYFRINDPYRFIGLLIVLLLLYLFFFIDVPGLTMFELKSFLVGQKVREGFNLYTQIVDHNAPLTGWVYAAADFVFGDSFFGRRIFGFFMVIVITATLGIIFIDKKVFPESSFIPPLILGILCGFSFDNFSLSGELFAIFFLLIALNSLFREIESREQNSDMVLKTGLFIGIATLFAFSFVVYIIATLIILILFTRSSGRKLALLVVAFLIPHFLLAGIYNYNDNFPLLWEYYYKPNLLFQKTSYVGTGLVVVLLAVPMLFFIASLVVVNSESRFTKYQSQVLQAMFFWTIFSFLQVYYAQDFRPQSFLPVMIGCCFFISHFFSVIIRRRFAELSFWIFLVGIVSVAYLVRYEVLKPGAYADLMVSEIKDDISGKKVVVLSNDIAIYRDNSMSTPFLNWKLSKDIFKEPDYYENVIRIADGFQKDLPEIIIDPGNAMKPFLERIPRLRSIYTRTPEGYRRSDTRASN